MIGISGHLSATLEIVIAFRLEAGVVYCGLVLVTYISTDTVLHNQSALHQVVRGDHGVVMEAAQVPVEEVHSTNIVPVQSAVTVRGPTECHRVVIHSAAAVVITL